MLPDLEVAQQGQGSVSADALNMKGMWAANVGNLRAFVGLGGMTVWMQGTSTPNDGGQGFFFFDPGATAADDDGVTTIQPSGITGTGRWIRQPITLSSIAANSIAYGKLAQAPGLTILGNDSGSAADVEALTVAETLALLGISNTGGGTIIAPGFMQLYAANSAPTGWYICDGSPVSRTGDAPLFAVIGTTFGNGDGSTTFNIPDCRGIFPRGWDSSGVVDPGRVFGSKQLATLAAHKHIQNWADKDVSGPFGQGGSNTHLGGGGPDSLNPFWFTNDGTTYSGVDPNGGSGVVGTETRPVNLAITVLVKR